MNILQKMKMSASFTESEQQINQYLLTHMDCVECLTSKQLCELTFVSPSTLYRYCQKLGVDGYDILKIELVKKRVKDEQVIDFDFPFLQDDTIETVCTNLKTLYSESIQQVYTQLDYQEVKHAAQILQESENIYFMTSCINTILAESFCGKLKEIGKQVKVSSSPYNHKSNAVNITQNDAVIIASYAGRSSSEFMELMPYLHSIKVPIVLITSTYNRKFFPYATCHLYMCDKEHPDDKLYCFSSFLSAQYLLDILYCALYQYHYDENFEKHKFIYGK